MDIFNYRIKKCLEKINCKMVIEQDYFIRSWTNFEYNFPTFRLIFS